jgi:outer membrane lipoprotein-sorting protein
VKKLMVCVLLFASACHDRRPPAPTAQQSEQLNDAENMLNSMAQNEEGPEQRPGPSNSSE